MKNKLQKTIMRRVYYAFALRLATHPVLVPAVALVALAWWLKELVFVARVWQSLVSRSAGELGGFVLEIVQHADTLTLLVTAAASIVAMRFITPLARLLRPLPQLA